MSDFLVPLCDRIPLVPGRKRVLQILAEYARDDGMVIGLAVGTIMQQAKLSRRTTQRALRDLESCGLIQPMQPHPGGQGVVAKYQIVLSRILPEATIMGVLDPSVRASLGRRMGVVRASSGKNDSNIVLKKQKNHPLRGTPLSATYPNPQELVAFYFDECKGRGYEPTKTWCAQLGAQVKRLADEKPQDLIRSAIRVIADEHKAPIAMAHVIADIESGRSRNGQRP